MPQPMGDFGQYVNEAYLYPSMTSRFRTRVHCDVCRLVSPRRGGGGYSTRFGEIDYCTELCPGGIYCLRVLMHD